MSEKGVTFRIDIILQSVNELRQEKRTLEQRYIDDKSRNKSLESKLEQDTTRFNQIKERNIKMQETVKVAEQKVSQTESQADRLTEINDGKKKVIGELNDKIKQEMEKQEHDVTEFEEKLLELTQMFRNAKVVYEKDTLNKEIISWKENMEVFHMQAENKNVELTDITKAFESLSMETKKVKEIVDKKIGLEGLTYKDLQVAIALLTRKQEHIHRFMNWVVSTLNRANARLEEFKRQYSISKDREVQLDKGEMESTHVMSGRENYNYVAEDQDSGLLAQTNFCEEPSLTNVGTSNNQKTSMLQSSFFISLPFSRSR